MNYLQWLSKETQTRWWHDSADPDELARSVTDGATGVTTNPVLANTALRARPDAWQDALSGATDLEGQDAIEHLLKAVVTHAAKLYEPVYQQTDGADGYACAQVDPARAGDRDAMLEMARRFHKWAPNIAVKLPVTQAGLDVLEECAADGITVTATVSFTVPQTIAVAERYRKGLARAKMAGMKTGQCFNVIMIGRIDDYLRDVAHDTKADVSESDIHQAGLAITKRSYALHKERSYEAVLLIAALRGPYHMIGLAGADLIMSIHPKYQDQLLEPGVTRDANGFAEAVPADVIERLQTIPEFVRAYEPDVMPPEEFMTYGVVQRTLTQFTHCGWAAIGQI